MDDFERELKSGFLEEACQLINDAEQSFLILESNPNDLPTLEKIFRIAHNIKGSSKAVGFDSLGAFTHEFESFLLKCKNGQFAVTFKTVSLMLKCIDHIRTGLEELTRDYSFIIVSDDLIKELHAFVPDAVVEQVVVAQEEEKVEISAEEMALIQAFNAAPESAVFEADQFSSIESTVENSVAQAQVEAIAQVIPMPVFAAPAPVAAAITAVAATQVTPAKQVATPAAASSSPSASTGGSTDESIRVSLARVEKLINFVGELVILQTVLNEQSFGGNPQALRTTIQQLGKVTKEVQELSMGLRMVPMKQTFQKMQRIVRDTSSALGKKVNLVLEGEETEVDKTVLEALGDPLVHLIRNAVDHGIEMPEDRIASGKPEQGEVVLKAYHQSGKLVIEIKDNGGGILAERLKQKAIEKNIIRANQEISEKDAINLIFHPGFSTKAQVTEVSGRGVGMDVVKTNISQLQGEIDVSTVPGSGSVFKIVLPLTLAIIDGMIVKCGDEKYIIPLTHVHESLKPEINDIKKATGLGEVLLLRGENLPVVRLATALGKKKQLKEQSEQIAVIIRTQSEAFATMVDDIIGQHQVVIKKLGSEMNHVRGYSGSAILGDGKPALILEMGDLVHQKRQAV